MKVCAERMVCGQCGQEDEDGDRIFGAALDAGAAAAREMTRSEMSMKRAFRKM